MSICTVTLVKAPESIIRRFIKYHLGIGVDEVMIFLDDANQSVSRSLSLIAGATIIPCTQEFWQSAGISKNTIILKRQIACLRFAYKSVKEKKHDWIIHIDIDEIIFTKESLHEILGRQNSEVVIFDLFEAVAESCDEKYLYAPVFFRKLASRKRMKLARFLTLNRPFFKKFISEPIQIPNQPFVSVIM